jgi:segregation and condensation protein A
VAYEVHLDVYDGPFNLLLSLISAEEVDVYEIKLSEIVDAFLAELAKLEAVDLDLATEFLLIAATLVELKCRRLLPGEDGIDLDEELSLFEARDYLLARLVECKTFTGAAAALAALEADAARAHPRRVGPDESFDDVAVDLLANVTPDHLAAALRAALVARPRETVASAHLHDDEVSVAETLDGLVGTLVRRPRTTLRELTAGDSSRPRFVATFLALLELYKRELVDLEQAVTFGELVVIWTGDDAPGLISGVEDYDDVAPRARR